MAPPYYGRKPEDGLHVLKDAWIQKEHIGPQAQKLAENLKAAVEATWCACQLRTQGFRLDRQANDNMDDRSRERRLERALLKRWNQSGMWSIPGAWDRLVSYQVPLFAQQQQESWGYIDLLGVNQHGIPVVVELKDGPAATSDGKTKRSETALRMVLEAAAYAVALRKNWENFRTEWSDRLKGIGVSDQIVRRVPDELTTVPLVAAAPASFWIDWLPVTEKGNRVTQETWRLFQSLLTALANEKLPVSFVSISGHCNSEESLAVQPLNGFPLICNIESRSDE